jgi:HD-like signal output (HDOD) protein
MRQILAEADFPAISKDALDALRMMPEDRASTQRLANLVMRDYSLTLKVLRTANSAYYKRAGQQIRSATHAMMLLGASTVRYLATSLLAFEHWRKRSPGLKELMLMSMLTANHARELAMRRRLPDPEEAHLAGMFRNLGEVLVAGYFPREYARILLHMELQRKTPGVAAFEVLGFSFEDLGELMAKHWGMPESVQASIRTDPAVAATELTVITSFAHELTQAAFRTEVVDQEDGVGAVMARYAGRLEVSHEDVTEVMRAALRETKEVFGNAKVTLDDLRLRRQFDAAILQLGGSSASPPTPASGTSPIAGGSASQLVLLRDELAAEVLQAARPDSGADLNRVFLTLVEALYRGGPFDRVVFCVMTRDGRHLKSRFGLGAAVEQLLDQFSFELTPRAGPLALAMLRRQSVWVPAERDFTSQELRFAQSLGASGFGVFPVVLGKRLAGCIYCDRPWNSQAPDRETIAFARTTCDATVRAISERVATGAPLAHRQPTPIRTTPQYSSSVKSEAVLRTLRGEDVAGVAHALGVPEHLLVRWRTEFIDGGVKGLQG